MILEMPACRAVCPRKRDQSRYVPFVGQYAQIPAQPCHADVVFTVSGAPAAEFTGLPVGPCVKICQPPGHSACVAAENVTVNGTVGVEHIPPEQVEPAAQAFPHMPQWLMLVIGSMHRPPQRSCPAGHEQVPLAQLRPPVHAIPHVPQLALSVAMLTQTPPHSVWPVGHTHRPLWQLCPEGQDVPHAPQFWLSI